MITIVEPQQNIDRLWGEQRIRENDTYRMMQYVLRVDHDGKVLLHNVVSGRLVVLEQEEAEAVEKLPLKYEPVMEQLVMKHYLVPEDFDEHQQVVNLRMILRKLDDVQKSKDIQYYTILPTTACNARCYYCFEHGCVTTTMTEQTAKDLVDYIDEHCGERRTVYLTWFGGEPTIASNRIDQICEGLKGKGIHFRSKMITNGYLFDQEMVEKAKSLWKLQALQICVDGTEKSYIYVKSFIAAKDNPYERVMHNIGLLLEHDIGVGLRMNFDLGNYNEFMELAKEAVARFGHNKLLELSAHPIIGEYKDYKGRILHGSDAWFTKMVLDLNNIAREVGLKKVIKRLPSINHSMCGAYSDSCVTITPDGSIVKCPEQFGQEQVIGSIRTGITNHTLVSEWKAVADYPMCRDCVVFPNCVRLVNCSNKSYCHKLLDFLVQCQQAMKVHYDEFKE